MALWEDFDDDDTCDDQDDLFEDIDDDDDDESEEDLFETLEYLDTCKLVDRDEIIADIRAYLKQYQPKYKLMRRKDL